MNNIRNGCETRCVGKRECKHQLLSITGRYYERRSFVGSGRCAKRSFKGCPCIRHTSSHRMPRRFCVCGCNGGRRILVERKRGHPKEHYDKSDAKRSPKSDMPFYVVGLLSYIMKMLGESSHGIISVKIYYDLSFGARTKMSASFPSKSFFFRVSFSSAFGDSPASFKKTFRASFAPMLP